MSKMSAKQLKKREEELRNNGLLIEGVHGSEKYSSLLSCLIKGLLIFLVAGGIVIGFSDSFSLEYNKPLIIVFTAVASGLVSLLYYNRKTFYFGYAAVFIFFTIELMRYYIYANSGFQAIMNTIRESYAEHFSMTYVRNAEELLENRYITVTIALLFLTFFLLILLNITISRYMNLAETFGIAFLVLELPLYIGYKPSILSIMMIMAGCICVGILQRGANLRMVIPSKGNSEFVYNRLFKKTYYTTRGNYRGILKILVYSAALAAVICICSVGVYQRRSEKTEPDSVKAAVDDRVKIIVRDGIWGFFDRYNSVNGLYRGALGGVSSARPDFETDIIVTYTPTNTDTLYLSGYKGSFYTGSNWYNYVPIEDSGFSWTLFDEAINEMDDRYQENAFWLGDNRAKIQISYIDRAVSNNLFPYVCSRNNLKSVKSPAFEGKDAVLDKKLSMILNTRQIEYKPLFQGKVLDMACDADRDLSPYIVSPNGDYGKYIYNYCTYVSGRLNNNLKQFMYEHGNLGLDLQMEAEMPYSTPQEKNSFRVKAVEAVKKLFEEEYPYTLSPGKTPSNEDFVSYFLLEQKKGYCSHFASAAVMLLRYMNIPARYIEGYCIPYSYVLKNGKLLETNASEWFEGTPEANLEKKTYSVEVNDYYAHAWIEVYLEGIGFVPFEVTPSSGVPDVEGGTGIRKFFAQLLNVDLGLGKLENDNIVISNDDSNPTGLVAGGNVGTFTFGPLFVIICLAALGWATILLIRYIRYRMMLKSLLKEERFDRLVFIAYNELVTWLLKKKLIQQKNPLPMELAELMKDYGLGTVPEKFFGFVERAVYSDKKTTSAEYEQFLLELDRIKYSLKEMKKTMGK